MKKTAICLVTVAFAAAAALSGCSNSNVTLSAKDYYDVEISGFNGNADISFDVDSSALDEVTEEMFKDVSYSNTEQYKKYLEFSEDMYNLEKSMTYMITSDKKDGFSNGDVIQVTLSYDEKTAAEMNIAFSDVTFDYTVEGLTEGTSIDPFEGLKIEYTGIAPDASISFDTTGCADYVRNNVSFYVDGNNYGYSNGETFTVTISYDESKAEKNAIMFTQESKQYTVEGVLEYPSTLDGVDLTEIDAQFNDMLDANALSENLVGSTVNPTYVTNDYSVDLKITKVEPKMLLKGYFYAKQNGNANHNNVYEVFWDVKVTAEVVDAGYSDKYKEGQKVTYSAYYIAYAYDIPVDADKNIPSEYITYGDEYYSGGSTTYNEIYNEWVTKSKANYTMIEMPIE